ncbi:MAG: 30S ribosomal protein S6 [Bryobacterales bacterium]|nr:30S ribosomal protein S6 [Acidobacteriota bacterium]MCB9385692.1 30S ribosomal protein S6 [Bryobacterales bacterium]
MRVYELVYIVKPDLPEEEVDATLILVRETLEGGGATIDKEEKWGKRRLAYRVQKYEDGYYVLVQYSLADDKNNAGVPKEVERRLRVADPVIKFMTVRIDEDLKRVEKAKKKREGRSSRRPSGGPGRPSSGDGGSSSESNAPGLPSGGKDDDNES